MSRHVTQVGSPMLHNGTVQAVVFSPDGSLLVSSGDDLLVRAWSVSTQQQLFHPAKVRAVCAAVTSDRLGLSVCLSTRYWSSIGHFVAEWRSGLRRRACHVYGRS